MEKSVILQTLYFLNVLRPHMGNLLYDTESTNPVSFDKLEGWDGLGGGKEVQEGGDIWIPMDHSC